MTSATAEKPANNSVMDKEALLKNTLSSEKSDSTEQGNRQDLHYYYSASNFKFVLEHGFKPETLEATEQTKVPFLPRWYSGIISIHGLIMPVIDLLAFAKSQNVSVDTNNNNKKEYLLKLEHANYEPIVFKLDSIPHLINIKQLKKVESEDDSPDWIKNYFENDTLKLASIDHQLLFDQLITQQ